MDLFPSTVFASMPAGPVADKLSHLARSAKAILDAEVAKDRAENDGRAGDTLKAIYMQGLTDYARRMANIALGIPSTVTDRSFLAFEGHLNNAIGLLRFEEVEAQLVGQAALLQSPMSRATKRVLREEISCLISLIDEADLDEKKKRALMRKARELQQELDQESANVVKLLTITAAIASILGGGSTFAVNAPKIVASVQRVNASLGDEVLDQEDQQLALPAPQKLLPAPQESLEGQGGLHDREI